MMMNKTIILFFPFFSYTRLQCVFMNSLFELYSCYTAQFFLLSKISFQTLKIQTIRSLRFILYCELCQVDWIFYLNWQFLIWEQICVIIRTHLLPMLLCYIAETLQSTVRWWKPTWSAIHSSISPEHILGKLIFSSILFQS